jgi:alcohol dehydrogenase
LTDQFGGDEDVGRMATASSTARAKVLERPRTLVDRTIPLPDIGSDDALVRVEACGLCGTDHEQYTGALPAGFAFVPGHETVGVIERVGAGAARRWGVAEGDRIAVEVFQSCRACAACARGEYRRCARHGLGDMYGFIDVDTDPGLWGGYATHQYLGPDAIVHRVPEGLDPVVATLFNPLGAGIRWGVTVPGTSAGDVVAVLGPGIRGLSALVAVKDAGAGFVMVTGHGPNDADRLKLAVHLGADLAVDVADTDPAKALRDATGGLADVVVDVTAKAPAALGQAVNTARPGGTVVVAGTRGTGETPGFWPYLVVFKELRILGALGVDSPAYRDALALLADDRHGFGDLPRRIADLDGIEELVRCMAGETDDTPPVHGVLVP